MNKQVVAESEFLSVIQLSHTDSAYSFKISLVHTTSSTSYRHEESRSLEVRILEPAAVSER